MILEQFISKFMSNAFETWLWSTSIPEDSTVTLCGHCPQNLKFHELEEL
jgi:hypothetical protein